MENRARTTSAGRCCPGGLQLEWLSRAEQIADGGEAAGVPCLSTFWTLVFLEGPRRAGQRLCIWASRLPASQAPQPRRPAPHRSLETPPALVAQVTSRLPTSKPLRARLPGNCSFALGGSKLRKAWRAGAAGSSRHGTALPSGNGSPPVASVPLQSPEHFRSPERSEGWRRVFCRIQPGCHAPHSANAVFPFLPAPSASFFPSADPRPPSPVGARYSPRGREPAERRAQHSSALDT